MPMHYQYQIVCQTENLSRNSKPVPSADEPRWFEAYSCLLFESWRRFNTTTIKPIKPLKPLRSGLVLDFDTDLPPIEVDTRVRHLVSRSKARWCGLSLVARCNKSSNARSVDAR